MKRSAMLIAAGLAAFAGVVLRDRLMHGAAEVYTDLSTTCMRASDGIRAHTEVVAMATALGLAVLALLAVASAARLVRHTTRALRPLGERGATMFPSRLRELTVALGLEDRLNLVDAEGLFAFCHGMLRPRLVMSRGLVDALTDDELEAVLRHEAAHMHRRDPSRIVIARSLASAFAFVPLSAGLLQAYLCRREIEADRESVNAMGDVRPLAGALHRMLGSARRPDLSSLAVGALTATDIRIDRLLGDQTSPRALFTPMNRLHLLVFTLAVTATLCVLMSTAHAATGVRPCLPC